MDSAKKAQFARKFGKRLHLKKGGVVRKFYDAGGTILGGPGNPTNTNTSGIGGITSGLGLNASSANIQQGTNAPQLNAAYNGTQNALTNQNNLTSTLTPQAATAVGNQNALATQEAAMAAGQGPNPAAAQLAQATGTNTANTAALIAGARGSSANPALAARSAALAGATNQQGEAGQAATMEANQQIAAQGNLTNLSANQINQTGTATTAQNTAEQNEQNTLENANSSANNAAVGMQSNINNVNAQQNQGILGGVTNALSNVPIIGSLFEEGGEVGKDGIPHGKHKLEFLHKIAKLGMQHYDGGTGSVEPLNKNSEGYGENSDRYQGYHEPPPRDPNPPATTPEVASALSNAFHAKGGEIQPSTSNWGGQYNQSQSAGGPNVQSSNLQPLNLNMPNANNATDPMAMANAAAPANTATFNNELSGGPAQVQSATGGQSDVADLMNAAKGGKVSRNHVATFLASGGNTSKVPAMVSPGEVYLSPEQVKKVINEGIDPISIGHKFKGKAKVKGDSLKNDDIPADLEEGGVVIDRKNMSTRQKRELFVHKSIAKHRAGSKL